MLVKTRRNVTVAKKKVENVLPRAVTVLRQKCHSLVPCHLDDDKEQEFIERKENTPAGLQYQDTVDQVL